MLIQKWGYSLEVTSSFAVGSNEFLAICINTLDSEMESYPTIKKLLLISLTLAAGSVDCERAFSLQNIIKTKDRNCLTADSLSNLMRCSRDGEDIKTFDWTTHTKEFLASKQRKIRLHKS